MALSDEVLKRYANNTVLQQLTNQGDESASSYDAGRLSTACTDVQADFLTYTATTYDNSDAQHVAVACQGVMAYLYIGAEAPGSAAQNRFDAYIERLRSLAKVTGRDRANIKSKSVLTPSSEQQGTETVRPDTDRPTFDDLVGSSTLWITMRSRAVYLG